MNDTKGGGSGEFGPVGSSGEPVEVLAEEEVGSGAGIGESVHE
jgi:hypothetical protein